MSKNFFLLTGILVLIGLKYSIAQVSNGTDMYPDYQRFLGSLKFSPPDHRTPGEIYKNLLDSAALLADDVPPGYGIAAAAAKKRTLADEEIYAARKSGVFIVGKLKKATGGPSTVSFDLTGTAFAISADGICVTNYHVLKDIIDRNEKAAEKDSAWFIVTHEKEIFMIDKILAYSRNNDLAVFRISSNGARFNPVPFGKPAQVGAAVYCISHPGGYLYYFSKGIVARNVTISPGQVVSGNNPRGKTPMRMEISADYGSGSSGGPVLDKYGNLVGIISTTTPVGSFMKDDAGSMSGHQQMVVRDALPVGVLRELLGMDL